jgi:O-antigen/teichoic acid export membrane protein
MSDQALGNASIKRVAFGGVTAFAIYVAGTGVTACAQLLIARIVGAETYGVYAYVMAWMTILAYFSALGFAALVIAGVAHFYFDHGWLVSALLGLSAFVFIPLRVGDPG